MSGNRGRTARRGAGGDTGPRLSALRRRGGLSIRQLASRAGVITGMIGRQKGLAMNPKTFADCFPLGSHLCREPMPAMAELKRDMEILKRNGFNLVKLQEHWMIDEPQEGACDFSRYEELIEHAATLDMGVYLGFTCEQAPHWLYEKYPDCRMVRRDGLTVAYEAPTTLPADGKPGPCPDHAGALADQLRFLSRAVRTLGRFENVVVWNTWQEIGWWAEGLVGGHVCYCPHTLKAFRGWLRERYASVDALNRAWNSRYADWNAVQPERHHGPQPCPQEIEWRTFLDNVQIARLLQARADAIRKADPLKRPVFAHKGGPAFASGQDWTYARCQDFLGSSCYPAWGFAFGWDDNSKRPFPRHEALLAEMWSNVAYRYDHIRCANPPGRPVWAAEFQGGPVSTGFHKGRVPSPDDIRRWMLTAVGSGVTAVSFWVTRAEIMASECNGFSLLDSSGETTPRLEEAGRIGRALNRYPDLFARPTQASAAVALVVGEDIAQGCQAQTQAAPHLGYSVRGWYRLLWESGIPVDLIETSEVGEARARGYKALILPFPLFLSERTAQALAKCVKDGVHLISEAVPGRMNELGFCARGEMSPVLAELFGVRHGSFAMVQEPNGGQRWSPAERTWGEYLDPAMLAGTGPLAGRKLRANVYVQTLVPEGGAPCLMHGKAVAGVVRNVGDGTAWLLGTYVGHSGTAYRDAQTRLAVRTVLAACGVKPERAGKLLLRRRVAGNREAWFFTNPTAAPVTEAVNVTGWKRVEDLLGQRLLRKGGSIRLTVKSLDVRVLVLERDARLTGGSR